MFLIKKIRGHWQSLYLTGLDQSHNPYPQPFVISNSEIQGPVHSNDAWNKGNDDMTGDRTY